MKHVHTFELHYGVKVFGGRGTAWVRAESLAFQGHKGRPEMWMCSGCGEPGYEVPA